MSVTKLFLAALALLGTACPLLGQETEPEPQRLPVGHIACSSGLLKWFTTATVVDDRRTILAAGHFDTISHGGRLIQGKASRCEFRLYDVAGVVSFRSKLAIIQRGGGPFERTLSRATDWSLLELERQVPAETKPLALKFDHVAPKRKKIAIHGFVIPGRGDRRSIVSCDAWPASAGSIVLRYNCLTAPGWSGAPLISRKDGQAFVLGVHSGRWKAYGEGVGLNLGLAERMSHLIDRNSAGAFRPRTTRRSD